MVRRAHYPCRQCGQPIWGRWQPPKGGRIRCRGCAKNRTNKGQQVTQPCVGCGTLITGWMRPGNKGIACNAACQRAYLKTRQRRVSPEAKNRREHEKQRRMLRRRIAGLERQVATLIKVVERMLPNGKECHNCGAELTGKQAKFCGEPCNNQHKKRRRRARKAGARGKIKEIRIFERDKWQCWICGRKTRRTNNQTDPKQATIDHVIPLSKGGQHTAENVACACRSCNVKKRDRVVTLF